MMRGSETTPQRSKLREEIPQACGPLVIQLTKIDVPGLRYSSRCGLELFELRQYLAQVGPMAVVEVIDQRGEAVACQE